MAKLNWFSLHPCSRLASGEFDLPTLPFRVNRSGITRRKLEPERVRGIQDFGAPRTELLLLPPPVPHLSPRLPTPSCGGFVGCSLAASLAAVPTPSRSALAAPTPLPKRLAHYFAGTYGLVGAAARRRCWEAHEVDVLTGIDVRDEAIAAAELAAVARASYGAIAMGPPCSSFSVNLEEDDGKYELRSWEHADGLPLLAPVLRARVDLHNDFVVFTFEVALRQLRAGGELLIENPAGRYDPRWPAYWPKKAHMPPIWAASPMRRLLHAAEALGRKLELLRAPQCAFGPGPHGFLYQKWTEFLVTPATARRLRAFNSLRCLCPPGAHTHARGIDAAGLSKAARAAAYPVVSRPTRLAFSPSA